MVHCPCTYFCTWKKPLPRKIMPETATNTRPKPRKNRPNHWSPLKRIPRKKPPCPYIFSIFLLFYPLSLLLLKLVRPLLIGRIAPLFFGRYSSDGAKEQWEQ